MNMLVVGSSVIDLFLKADKDHYINNENKVTFTLGDKVPEEIEKNLNKEGIDLLANTGEENSSLSLIFNFDSDRIIFSHHPIKQYIFEYNKETKPDFIYLTSIGKYWQECYGQVLEFAKQNNIPL